VAARLGIAYICGAATLIEPEGKTQMAGRFKTAFFAYPAEPPDLTAPIEAAVQALAKSDHIKVTRWPEVEIFGINIPDKIREGIEDADVLLCDITKPNLNVYYEIGFAIGLGNAIAPVINTSFADATNEIQNDGLFDSIGYRSYENSLQLSNILQELPATLY
jgi:hypothetical protein